jgi:hypothetical protein
VLGNDGRFGEAFSTDAIAPARADDTACLQPAPRCCPLIGAVSLWSARLPGRPMHLHELLTTLARDQVRSLGAAADD